MFFDFECTQFRAYTTTCKMFEDVCSRRSNVHTHKSSCYSKVLVLVCPFVCFCLFLRSIVMSVSVYGSVCLSARISPEPHARSLPNLLCVLPMSVARSSFDKFTIGRIAYRREGIFFPIENALSAGKGGWECTARAKCTKQGNRRLPCFVTDFYSCTVLLLY